MREKKQYSKRQTSGIGFRSYRPKAVEVKNKTMKDHKISYLWGASLQSISCDVPQFEMIA